MYSEIKISLLTGMRKAIQLVCDICDIPYGMLESGTGVQYSDRVMNPDSDAITFLSSTVVAKYTYDSLEF